MTLETKIPPPIIALGCIGVGVFSAKLLPYFDMPFEGICRFISLLLVGVALLILTYAGVQFVRKKTTLDPRNPEKASTLVTRGVYAYSRNPMYLGLAMLVAGCMFYLSSVVALLMLPVFVSLMNALQISAEERQLAAIFGDEYQRYKSKVRRWL